MLSRKAQGGFTLIELMIVVVILGILVGVGLPSYQRAVVRSVRVDAKAALMGFAQSMERRYGQTYTYAGAAAGGADTGAPDPTVFPSQAPLEGEPAYALTIQAADATGFTLRATPLAGGRQDGDGFLQVNSLGVRSWDRNNNGAIDAPAENTWER